MGCLLTIFIIQFPNRTQQRLNKCLLDKERINEGVSECADQSYFPHNHRNGANLPVRLSSQVRLRDVNVKKKYSLYCKMYILVKIKIMSTKNNQIDPRKILCIF